MVSEVVGVTTQNKNWGQNRLVFRDQNSEVWHASILKHGFSSRHYHRNMVNDFYLVSGKLTVNIFVEGNAEPISTYTLHQHEKISIPSGVQHSFYAVEECELIETYYHTHITSTDIVRLSSTPSTPVTPKAA
jgi:quercetin dioxygenase-like cupin family protein